MPCDCDGHGADKGRSRGAISAIPRFSCSGGASNGAQLPPVLARQNGFSLSIDTSMTTPEQARIDAYHVVLTRAVSQLTANTYEARQALYERARAAQASQLTRQSEWEIASERFALETAIRRIEQEVIPHRKVPTGPHDTKPENRSLENPPRSPSKAPLRKVLTVSEKVPLSSPLHRPSTAILFLCMLFFPRVWLLDITCMSLYWVARVPRFD